MDLSGHRPPRQLADLSAFRIKNGSCPAASAWIATHYETQMFSRKLLQAFGRAEASTPALNVRPAFAFEMYDLAQRQGAKADWTVAIKQAYRFNHYY
jgi:hypothetical protein